MNAFNLLAPTELGQISVLEPVSISAPSTVRAGEQFQVEITVRCRGREDPPEPCRTNRCAWATVKTDDQTSDKFMVTDLDIPPNESQTFTQNVSISQPGEHNIIAHTGLCAFRSSVFSTSRSITVTGDANTGPLVQTDEPGQANITIRSVEILNPPLTVGQQANVSIVAQNTGGSPGSKGFDVVVNGQEVGFVQPSIGPSDTQQLIETFRVPNNTSVTVRVGGKTSTVSTNRGQSNDVPPITNGRPLEFPLSMVLVIGGGLLVLLFLIVAL